MTTAPKPDLVIRNASIIDGSGAPARSGDIAISGDRVSAIGALAHLSGATELDVGGRAVAPGFIDRAHARRPRGPERSGHDLQGEPGRHHRRHRELRDQLGAPRTRGPSASAIRSDRRPARTLFRWTSVTTCQRWIVIPRPSTSLPRSATRRCESAPWTGSIARPRRARSLECEGDWRTRWRPAPLA